VTSTASSSPRPLSNRNGCSVQQEMSRFDRDHGLEATVHRVEVRRSVIRVIHVDQDTVEFRDPGHRRFHRGTSGPETSLAPPSLLVAMEGPRLVSIRKLASGSIREDRDWNQRFLELAPFAPVMVPEVARSTGSRRRLAGPGVGPVPRHGGLPKAYRGRGSGIDGQGFQQASQATAVCSRNQARKTRLKVSRAQESSTRGSTPPGLPKCGTASLASRGSTKARFETLW